MRIIALDVSSTAIGWVIADDRTILKYGAIIPQARKGIERRFCQAYIETRIIAQSYKDVQYLCIEGPAKGFYMQERQYDIHGKRKGPGLSSLIQQQRMAGVVIAAIMCEHGPIPIIDIAPTSAKKALAGNGTATKEFMVACAESDLGQSGISEHTADALGVLYAGIGILITQ